MTEEEKALRREVFKAGGFNDKQIDAMIHKEEVMARPDDDPEKFNLLFDRAMRG